MCVKTPGRIESSLFFFNISVIVLGCNDVSNLQYRSFCLSVIHFCVPQIQSYSNWGPAV